jgi:hypothetical protein
MLYVNSLSLCGTEYGMCMFLDINLILFTFTALSIEGKTEFRALENTKTTIAMYALFQNDEQQI